MELLLKEQNKKGRKTFRVMSVPTKALATCIILTLAFGMLGATGQVIIHDIIPTLYSDSNNRESTNSAAHHNNDASGSSDMNSVSGRGDLFSELSPTASKPEEKPFYMGDQFVWTLKWTHIHLFGMGMIFIFMGAISLFLDAGAKFRTWLIVLPFIGVLIDILAMWLKGFVSPVFFWLHLPGGGIFGLIFGYVSLRALWEMWVLPASS
jgi:hypothetical protein